MRPKLGFQHRGRKPGLEDLRAIVRGKLDNLLNGRPNCGNYFQVFSAEERKLIEAEMPMEVYRIFNFSGTGEFMRENFPEWIKGHRISVPFAPPDLSGEASPYAAATAARGRWWISNRLPLGDWERRWLIAHQQENHGKPN